MPRLLVVVAHPDDETFGTGSVIANAAEAGLDVTVCCATRGEAGEDTSHTTSGPDELAIVRESELRTAARVLGATDVRLLDFADSGFNGDMPNGALAAVPIDDVVEPVAALITEVQPDIVVTLDHVGIDDHRDHSRIGLATTHAFERAARPDARLYYWTLARSIVDRWQSELRGKGLLDAYTELDLGRPDDQITSVVDVSHLAERRWSAILEHKTQTSPYHGVSDELRQAMLARDCYVRVVPAWDGGPVETKVF